MSSRLTKNANYSVYDAQSPKSDDDKSVDDMLANVDQFIAGVYRDLSLSPPRRSSTGNTINSGEPLNTSNASSSLSTTSPASPGTLPITSSRSVQSPVSSPTVLRNMDAEIDRINRICDNVDQNLRSIGIFMNNVSPSCQTENLSNTDSTNSPSVIIVNNTSPSIPSVIRRKRQRKQASVDTTAEPIIDLSNSQVEIPEIIRRPHNDDDDDVILVAANITHVVDLCTPDSNQEIVRPRHTTNYEHLNRRRLHRDSFGYDLDGSSEETTPSRKRRTESKFTASDNSCLLINEAVSASNGESCTPFMCPVCMDSCLHRQPTSTLCGHVFCKRCIERAIALTHKCPLCNKRVSKRHIFRIYL